MRKFFIIAASIAALAIPTAAMANVTLNSDGTTSIGKGDVQNALGYANDAAFQADAKSIRFSLGSDTTSMIWGVKCAPLLPNGLYDTSGIHEISVNAGTVSTTANTPNITVLRNNQGKVTGYTQTGVTGATTYVGAIDYSKPFTSCPSGEAFYSYVNFDHPFQNVTVPGSSILTVSNGVKTVALPVTPTV